MNELYWITRLDAISAILCVFAALSVTAFIMSAICYAMSKHDFGDDDNGTVSLKKASEITFISSVVLLLLAILVPTTKEACFIYIGGHVIEYVEGNEKLQEMPDKIVELADKYLDEMLEEGER